MSLTNAAVFARLRARGATRVEIQFSGGNDEGGADAIRLYAGEKQIGDLPAWSEHGATDRDSVLVAALTEPIYERWGDFGGDFWVHGTLTWDVTTATTSISGEQSAMESFDE